MVWTDRVCYQRRETRVLKTKTDEEGNVVISGTKTDLEALRRQVDEILLRTLMSDSTQSYPEWKQDGSVESIWVTVVKE